MYGEGVGTGVGVGVATGVGVAMGVGVEAGVGLGFGVGDSETRASVPHRRTEPIVTLSRPVRSNARKRVVVALLKPRLRLMVPVEVDVTVRRRRIREPNPAQLPR
jgi:hypothetical protein